MNSLKKLTFIFLIIGSFFVTGCDAENVLRVINQVADAVQKVSVAIREVVNVVNGVTSPGQTAPPPQRPAAPDADAPSPASVPISSPSAEEITIDGNRTSPADNVSSGSSGSIQELKNEMRSRYGVNAVDGSRRWTSQELQALTRVLATLPENFRRHTQNIRRQGIIDGIPGVMGSVVMGIPTVNIADAGATSRSELEGTLVHEMTHTFQANNQQITEAWKRQFWRGNRPVSSSVSSYGNTEPMEDMAESVRAYWQSGPRMKQTHPDRYEFIKRNVMNGKEF